MNIKVKENAGSFEQSFAKMLDKIYGNNGNVKVEVKKTNDGTLYTVLTDFDQVDFLFKTDKGTKAPTCDITIGGDTLFTKTGEPKKKVKTYYGLFDEDPTILRSFQQILQKYIDGVDLDLPWLRFEESNKSEDKRNYYGYGKDEPIDKEDNNFMFQVAYDWFEKKLPHKLKDYADNAVNKVIDKDMRSYEEIETMDDYYDYLEKYGPDIVEEIKNDHADESKKSEADYSTSRVSKSIADAYKLLDDYFCDNNGNLRTDAINKIYTTFRNESDLTARSKSKATKSHSLAWETLIREINATLEWDDEFPHATSLTSEQVKNWFKLKGRDFKEDLKPLVDAIDAYRNKKGESMKNEANIDDLKGMVVSDGTMGVNVLIRKYLDVLKTYSPNNYKAYIEANPELKDRDVWMALDIQDKSYIVDELADELDKIAPEGYYFGASEGDGACFGFWSVDPDESKNKNPESKCGDGKDDKGKKPEESAKPVKNILRRRFEVLTKSVLHACDKLVKDASLAGEFDDEVIYAEDAVKNAVESFNAMGDAIVRLKTVLESHKNEDNMEIIGILSDAITKIVADEQGDETDAATAGADSVIDQVEREYGNEPENEPEANGEENEAPSPAGAEAPDEF